jgi:aldehyde:ferredoxin oxidoreductase
MPAFGTNPEQQIGRGTFVRDCSLLIHVVNSSGLCLFGYLSMTLSAMPDFLTAVTGVPYSLQDVMQSGEHIGNIRQAFTAREGVNLVKQPVPGRAYGRPPLPDGPTAGITVNVEQMGAEFLESMGWTTDGAVPTAEKLQSLGMDDVAQALWGSGSQDMPVA